MISGYLLQETTTAAFSKETLSSGSPSVFHIAYSETVARTPNGSIPSVHGIFLSLISKIQLSLQSLFLNVNENGPMYETKAADIKASPTIVTHSSFIVPTLSFHLAFSSANPFTSLLAKSSLSYNAFASFST